MLKERPEKTTDYLPVSSLLATPSFLTSSHQMGPTLLVLGALRSVGVPTSHYLGSPCSYLATYVQSICAQAQALILLSVAPSLASLHQHRF